MEKMDGPVRLEDIAEVCNTCYESVSASGHGKCNHIKVIIIASIVSVRFHSCSHPYAEFVWFNPHICRNAV